MWRNGNGTGGRPCRDVTSHVAAWPIFVEQHNARRFYHSFP